MISKDLRSRVKKYVTSIGLDDSDYLLNVNGRQYTTIGLQQELKRAVEQAGLPESYSIHCLRHTFGTMIYEQDKDLRMVQRLLGHASINTTQINAGVSKEPTYRVVN